MSNFVELSKTNDLSNTQNSSVEKQSKYGDDIFNSTNKSSSGVERGTISDLNTSKSIGNDLTIVENESEYLNDKDKIFYSGANFKSTENIDNKIYNWAESIQDSQIQEKQVKGLISPWERRFGDAYTATQSIGSDMPHGPQWVGSPSIMNNYALIRFAHVANSKHHLSILDQEGSVAFRTNGVFKPSMKLSDLGDSSESYIISSKEKVNIDGESYSEVDKERLQSSGFYSFGKEGRTNEKVYADSSGQLFVIYDDKNLEIWSCSNKDVYKKGGFGDQSTEDLIVQVKPEWEDGTLSKENTNGVDYTQNRPGVKGPSGKPFDVNSSVKPFWAERMGLVKCEHLKSANPNLKVDGSKYTSGAICNALKQDPTGNSLNEDEYKKLTAPDGEIKKSGRLLNAHVQAGWEFKAYQQSRQFIPKPGTESQGVVMDEIQPTYENLCNVENWKGNEQFSYQWSDFMYCSEFGMSPNNRLVTLRRFPVPVYDHGRIPTQDDSGKFMLPVAKAVTWIGSEGGNTMESLTGFSWKMLWKELNADVHEVQGNEQGLGEGGIAEEGGMMNKMGKVVGILSGGANFDTISGKAQQMSKFDPYKDGPYSNLPYGPVNSINKTLVRERGLEFDHGITLTFKYDLNSIGGVNPKAALLDIMANFLALTYNNAPFWGGAVRYFPNSPAYPFLGAKKGMDAWYNGDVGGFLEAIGDQFTEALANLGDMLLDLFSNPMAALKKMGGQGARLWMAKKQAGKRPAMLGFKGLLTGESIGEWHLVVGNPFNPIMMMGNLVVEGGKLTLAETLGADDFPEWVKFEVTLKHARPRDKGDIESMFNRGQGRLHYSYPGSTTEPWNSASSTNNSTGAVKNVGTGKGNSKTDGGLTNTSVMNKNAITGGTTYEGTTKETNQSAMNKVNTSKKYKIEKFTGISSVDNVFSTPFRQIKKVYGAGAKTATKLAEKVGQKNARENKSE